MHETTTHSATFDGRADDFDRRSSPPPEAAAQIARAVDRLAASVAGGSSGPNAVLDLGAGTGSLGAPLADLCSARGAAYLGLDVSLGMLTRFRTRAADAALLRADASQVWPLADASVAAIFVARAAHLLGSDHFVHEVRRVAASGAVLVLGAVRRDDDSHRAVLRRKLHELLAERGFAPRSARRRHAGLARQLGSPADTAPAAPEVVASWNVTETLEQALAAWRRPGHLAGRDLPGEVRAEVLDHLHQWALDRWREGRYDPVRVHSLSRESSETATIELCSVERFELTTRYLH